MRKGAEAWLLVMSKAVWRSVRLCGRQYDACLQRYRSPPQRRSGDESAGASFAQR